MVEPTEVTCAHFLIYLLVHWRRGPSYHDGRSTRHAQAPWLWEEVLQGKVSALLMWIPAGLSNQFPGVSSLSQATIRLSSSSISCRSYRGCWALTTTRCQAGPSMTTQWQRRRMWVSEPHFWPGSVLELNKLQIDLDIPANSLQKGFGYGVCLVLEKLCQISI